MDRIEVKNFAKDKLYSLNDREYSISRWIKTLFNTDYRSKVRLIKQLTNNDMLERAKDKGMIKPHYLFPLGLGGLKDSSNIVYLPFDTHPSFKELNSHLEKLILSREFNKLTIDLKYTKDVLIPSSISYTLDGDKKVAEIW